MNKTKKDKLLEEQGRERRHSSLKALATTSLGISVAFMATFLSKLNTWMTKDFAYKRYIEVLGVPPTGTEEYLKNVPYWSQNDTFLSAAYVTFSLTFFVIFFILQRLAYDLYKPR